MEKTQNSGKWKKPKKDQILIGILAGILLLVIALPQNDSRQETEEEGSPAENSQTLQTDPVAAMERQLEDILGQAEGVGRVKVMLTVSSLGTKTVEKDKSVQEENSQTSGEGNQVTRTEETTVYTRDSQGNEVPFVTEETPPRIEGVLIAAQGAGDMAVAESITEAAEVLFGVEVHKIKIMKMK